MYEGGLRKGIIIAAAVLLLTTGLGFAIISADREAGERLIQFLSEELFAGFMDENPFNVFVRIFLNNLQACALLFLGGASLGIFTMVIISVNGLLIGGVVAFGIQERGLKYILAALLPHGLLELPAFILSGALGVALARAVWLELGESGDASFAMRWLFRVFISRVIPLLAIAAFIESFITPHVIELMI